MYRNGNRDVKNSYLEMFVPYLIISIRMKANWNRERQFRFIYILPIMTPVLCFYEFYNHTDCDGVISSWLGHS